jgi:tetraacyldisaccharide 4'-kinase
VNGLSRGAIGVLSHVYSALARRRRDRAVARPELRRRLRRPVVSVGNLAVGGRGKTPVVAAIAGLLRDAGERPAILSRGYARERQVDGVLVVRTADRIEADVHVAGDEPFMLARRLDGVAVLVAEDRHLAGRVAESGLGCTVHILDDGFQHLRLARDVDLVLVTPDDLQHGRPLPAGRLREPTDAARFASALLVTDGSADDVSAIADTLGVRRRFEVRRRLTVPRMREPYGAPPRQPRAAAVLAVAGIAQPDRFFEDLVVGGWSIVDRLVFPDHHSYSRRDAAMVAERAHKAEAALVLTTEKDLVRWMPLAPLPFPLAWVPLEIAIEPWDQFTRFLLGAIRDASAGQATAVTGTLSH